MKARNNSRIKNGSPKLPDTVGTAWTKSTVGGPSGPAVDQGGSPPRKGDGPHDETTAGRRLSRKVAATDALACGMPYNPLKAAEY